MLRCTLCLLIAAGLAATPALAQPSGRGPLFVSPAGAVYRAQPHQGPPIAIWFAQADANGDGAIDWAEFQADFERAFASFDTNGDGEIAPDEITRYETEILPEMAASGSFFRGPPGRSASQFGPGGRNGGPRPRARTESRGTAALMSGAARFGLLPIPHPIMDADSNFNRGVTRAEWAAAAQSRFNQLNRGGDGLLRLDRIGRAAGPQPDGRRPQRDRRD